MLVSIVIRTLNESRHLGELLSAIKNQRTEDFEVEVVIVDSGSEDETLKIAEDFDCRITHIKKQEFTFGRSLNVGCEFAKGDYLVFISGHCIPSSDDWLDKLIAPLRDGSIAYSYGRQIGRDDTKYSERCLFGKYFPEYSKVPQEGFYCNNANAALSKKVWMSNRFDESLTGLEDMHLAKAITAEGMKVAYLSDAAVFHIHDESWRQVRIRYEREAYALRQIIPEVHLNLLDVIQYYVAGVLGDMRSAIKDRVFFSEMGSIIIFRFMQYLGAYHGNHEHRKLSQEVKLRYFYPQDVEKHIYEKEEDSSLAADEGK